MDYFGLLMLAIVVPAGSMVPTKGKLDNKTVMELIAWQEAIEEVNTTSILAQVLQEYLEDIELVEAAASKCAVDHRDKYHRAQATLYSEMNRCVNSSSLTKQKETLTKCVEERTKLVVSDTRLQITRLKSCLDYA